MAKMLQIGEILRGPGRNLLVGIRVMDAINGFPSGPGTGGRSKSGVERVIFGRHLGMLGSLEHGAKMVRNGEICRTPPVGLVLGIHVVAAVIVIPRGSFVGGNLKSGVGGTICGRQMGVLGDSWHLAKMARNWEIFGTPGGGLLVGIWVIATINVLSMGSISMAKSRFGIEKPVVWCRVGLLGRLQPRTKNRGMYKICSGWGRGLQAGIWVIAAGKVLPMSTSGGSKTNWDV